MSSSRVTIHCFPSLTCISRRTLTEMCYLYTPYYLLCGCYGKRQPFGELCIRAKSLPGHSSGCWERVDKGVESVDGECPRCKKTYGTTNRQPAMPALPPDGLSTAECAKLLLASLPESVRSKRKSENVFIVKGNLTPTILSTQTTAPTRARQRKWSICIGDRTMRTGIQ